MVQFPLHSNITYVIIQPTMNAKFHKKNEEEKLWRFFILFIYFVHKLETHTVPAYKQNELTNKIMKCGPGGNEWCIYFSLVKRNGIIFKNIWKVLDNIKQFLKNRMKKGWPKLNYTLLFKLRMRLKTTAYVINIMIFS